MLKGGGGYYKTIGLRVKSVKGAVMPGLRKGLELGSVQTLGVEGHF